MEKENRIVWRIYYYTPQKDKNGLPDYKMLNTVFVKLEDAQRVAVNLSHKNQHGWIEERHEEQRIPGGDWTLDWLRKICPKEVVGKF